MKKLIHFSAEWCMPCKNNQTIVEKFLQENPDIEYKKIDIDKEPEVAKEYSVMGVPTYVSYWNGKMHDRKTGSATRFQLEQLFG